MDTHTHTHTQFYLRQRVLSQSLTHLALSYNAGPATPLAIADLLQAAFKSDVARHIARNDGFTTALESFFDFQMVT